MPTEKTERKYPWSRRLEEKIQDAIDAQLDQYADEDEASAFAMIALDLAEADYAALEAERDDYRRKYEGLQRSVSEGLNTGNGSYRP